MQASSRYRLTEKILESKNTLIYRAKSQEDNKSYILKILKAEYPTPAQLRRFQQEYEITNSFSSNNIIKAYGLEDYQNKPVIIFEDFDSVSLTDLPEKGRLKTDTFLELAIQITDIVREIHEHDIIHKDINPSNFLIHTHSGKIKIIDFGISTRLSLEQPKVDNIQELEGTLQYLSPEQTGRMKKYLDYRSDYYSLGATLYELLSGKPPFDTNDPIELVHSHIARNPIPLHELDNAVPETVSRIILKLLAKTPENRYQSAAGIIADLKRCLNELRTDGSISLFELGQRDISSVFAITHDIYGRESEIKTLLAGYEDACAGKKKLVLVGGYSGVGKSSLVHKFREAIGKKRAYFTSGRFKQLQTSTAYAPLIQIFQELVRLVLTESISDLDHWKKTLIDSLGSNGRIIVNIIPEIELLIGPQPAVPELPAQEAENHFKLVFRNFVRTCTTLANPLTIFLDDMQWADSTTLKLMELVISDPEISSILIICSYRSNEVSSSHPLQITFDRIRKTQAEISTIKLGPISNEQIKNLISKSLHCSHELAAPLAEICLQKTDGNPFFLKQFLHSLHQKELIKFDTKQRVWCWDIESIQDVDATNNVVELMMEMIEKLPLSIQKVLQLAACIGDRFDLETLAAIHEKSQGETLRDIRQAREIGFIVADPQPEKHGYGIEEKKGTEFSIQPDDNVPHFRFTHDQIQHVAYSLIPEEEKRIIHLKIGRLILKNNPDLRHEHKILQIVRQLNLGSDLIEDIEEKSELAELNLLATRIVKALTAYAEAIKFLEAGIALLSKKCWQQHYHLSLALYTETIELYYLTSRFTEMHNNFNVVMKNGRTLLDKVKAYEILIQAYKAQNRLMDAVKTGLFVLNLFGLTVPEKITKLKVLYAFLKVKISLLGKKPEDLLALPRMTDPYKQAVMNILTNIGTAAYYAAPNLFLYLAFKSAGLSIKYGNTSQSAVFGYPVYGFLQCAITGDIETGYKYGMLSLELQKKLLNGKVNPLTVYLVTNLIRHWKEHLRKTLPLILEAYKGALDIGHIEIAANSAYSYSYRFYFAGNNLKEVEKELAKYREEIDQLGQQIPLYRQMIFQQMVQNLLIPNKEPFKLIGDFYNEEEMIPRHEVAHDGTTLFILYLAKLMHSYLFQEFNQARENALLAEKYLGNVIASIFVPLFYFYYSLTLLAIYNDATLLEKIAIRKKITSQKKKMRKWANHSQANYQHKYMLIEAELSRVTGRDLDAMEYYDNAIQLARDYEYYQEEALALELAARFYLDRKRNRIAVSYMQGAYHCYEKWGADVKILWLRDQYRQIIATSHISNQEERIATFTVTSSASLAKSSQLDLMTVIKSSMAMTKEIILDDFLMKMMKIVIENAGAQRGYLLFHENDYWTVKTMGTVDRGEVRVTKNIPIGFEREIPQTLVDYVARTRKEVVLDSAVHNGLFTNDEYVVKNKPKSIICLPVIHQGKISCILYLENNLIFGAFTPDRLATLNIMGAQAGISLRNSQLYEELEATIEKLHTEMEKRKETQQQLLHVEKLTAIGRLTASIAHEFGNPLTGIRFLLSDILKRVNFNSEDKKLLNVGLEECDRMRSLIRKLNKFNRPSLEKRKLVDIHHIIENVLLFQKKYLESKKITLVRQFDTTIPKIIAVEDQITQVFINLIINAADATPKEGGTVTISTTSDSEVLQIAIKDTGSGISEKNHKLIFEPFFSTKTEDGTGLGLSNSYIIINNHGGSITVSSKPGHGATFTITLPLPFENYHEPDSDTDSSSKYYTETTN